MSVVSNNILAGASGQGGAGYEIERSLRFNSGDSAYLNKTSVSGNRKTWTYSAWVKRSRLTAYQALWSTGYSGTNYSIMYFDTNDNLFLQEYNGSTNFQLKTAARFRDLSAFYHVVLVFDSTQSTNSDKQKIYINGQEQATTGTLIYPTLNYDSLFNAGYVHAIGRNQPYANFYLDGYLADVHFIDGQALTPTDFGETNTDNLWVPKAFAGTYGTNGFHLDFADNSSNAALGTDTSGNSNTWTVNNLTADSRVYSNSITTTGNSGSWYPTYPATNIFDATTTNYGHANGDGSVTCVVTFSLNPAITSTTNVSVLGGMTDSGTAEISINGGTAVALTSGSSATTETTVAFSGSISSIVITKTSNDGAGLLIYGFKIDGTRLFDGVPANIDCLVDTPTNGDTASDTGAGNQITGNYCTWNPIDKNSNITLTNGNLDIAQTAGGIGKATFHVSSGKWYWEVLKSDATNSIAGMAASSAEPTTGYLGSVAETAGFVDSGILYATSPFSKATTGTVGATTNGDLMGFALDCDNGTLKLYINNVLQTANHFTFTPGLSVTPALGTNVTRAAYPTNFGQRAFAYAAPSGYKTLNTANLPEPTIADGSQYFDVVTYPGASGDTSITSLSFQPEFVWIKNRSASNNHLLFDAIRGATEMLRSDTTDVENANTNTLKSFDSNGFTVGDNAKTGASGSNYVGWAWDAGSSNTTIAAGGLNSSVYDQSQTWSNNWTGSFYSSSYDAENIFDGNLSTWASVTYPGSSGVTLTVSPAITGSTIRVYYSRSNSSTPCSVNGTETLPSTGSANTYQWHTLSATSISSFTLTHDNSGSSYLAAIEVDGKILVDSGVTPPNLPSIASTVRANPSAGFSIVSYTGSSSAATVGHGLNAAPGMIIVKDRDSGSWNWQVAHSGIGADDSLLLNATNATADYNAWNNTRPTSSVFSLGGGISGVSTNGNAHIAYCFAPVEGYSAFGSYTGNGSADGPFVFLGFRPAFLLVKNTASGLQWPMFDSTRFDYNGPNNPTVYANSSGAETADTDNYGDFLSNGFKARQTNGNWNASGATYIYAAFAEHPFKNSRAR